MTRTQYNKAIHYQITRLNEQIDSKILRGQTYTAESKKHKALLSKLRNQSTPSFFSRLLLAFH